MQDGTAAQRQSQAASARRTRRACAERHAESRARECAGKAETTRECLGTACGRPRAAAAAHAPPGNAPAGVRFQRL